MSCQRLFHNVLAKWKSRKFVNTRRASKSLGKVDAHWRQRIDDALACPDNGFIDRVADAGQLVDGVLTMHNGIRVGGLGYCGAGVLNMLVDNRGVHEPQEERAFGDVLQHIPAGGAMLELGAYWGFYSLWFAQEVAAADCHLLEPHPTNIRSGQINFQLNNRQATFGQAYAAATDGTASDGVPLLTVDSYCLRQGIARLAVLHADIQGAEADMLHGAKQMLADSNIDFLFISTHSNDLHYECISMLKSHRYSVLASADLDETYSVDGLIVARGPHLAAPSELTISKKTHGESSRAA
jgi:hypothetical protein